MRGVDVRSAKTIIPDKERIARCFRQAATTYDRHASVQREVGSRLLDLAAQTPEISYDCVLEIGCCTGLLTGMLCQRQRVKTLYLNDLVPEFEKPVLASIPAGVIPEIILCFGDIEQLPLPDGLSLILSSSTFQWLPDLPGLLTRLAQALRPGGFLVFSCFGPGTLAEFTALTGIGLDYRRQEALAALLTRDFVVEQLLVEEARLILPSPRAVLHHLRDTGVGGVQSYRWTKSALKRFELEYQSRFAVAAPAGDCAGVSVTYSSIYCIARKG